VADKKRAKHKHTQALILRLWSAKTGYLAGAEAGWRGRSAPSRSNSEAATGASRHILLKNY
jgi:hypothetical protein